MPKTPKRSATRKLKKPSPAKKKTNTQALKKAKAPIKKNITKKRSRHTPTHQPSITHNTVAPALEQAILQRTSNTHASNPLSFPKKRLSAKLTLQISLASQKIIDAFSKLTSLGRKQQESNTSPLIDPQEKSLTPSQKELWKDCINHIKQEKYSKLAALLKKHSKEDANIIRDKLLTDFHSFPFIISKLRTHLRQPRTAKR